MMCHWAAILCPAFITQIVTGVFLQGGEVGKAQCWGCARVRDGGACKHPQKERPGIAKHPAAPTSCVIILSQELQLAGKVVSSSTTFHWAASAHQGTWAGTQGERQRWRGGGGSW
jgi:hypothetical protein